MYPILFELYGSAVPSFFFMIMVGALVATYVVYKYAEEDGLSVIYMLDIAIISVIMSVIGGRIFHVLVEQPAYYWEDPMRVFYFWQGGFVSLGSYIFSAIGCVIYLRWRKVPLFKYFDIATLGVAMVIAFTRVGCLLAGCCFGRPTDSFLSITFHSPYSHAGQNFLGIPLHPSQIYAIINALILFIVLMFVYKRRKFVGQMTATFLIYLGITRFFIEFMRGDSDRGVYFNDAISTGQIVMLIFVAGGTFLYWQGLKKVRTTENISEILSEDSNREDSDTD
jgi:phosphatidylglycerol---prolipoprotein diacylglyceryl transferase